MKPLIGSVLIVSALALALGACASKSPPLTRTKGSGSPPTQQTGAVSVVTLRGYIKLDPRAGYQHPEGEIWQYMFYLDGELFDSLLCYAHAHNCALMEFGRGSTPSAWSATLAESLPNITPFVLHFEVPPDGDFRRASQVSVRVLAAGLGEIGATTLERDPSSRPPEGVRERARAEQTLRRVYEAISHAYRLAPAGQRRFPESRPERPSPVLCGPTRVNDDETVAWLGLSAPVVLSWSYSMEASPEAGTLRIIARRDRTCHGDLESLVLEARLDEYGDFERLDIVSSDAAGGAQQP